VQGNVEAGIKALLAIAKRDLAGLQAEDLAFAIAPRLNAAGRLDDMSHGIECLINHIKSQEAQMMAQCPRRVKY
jgi:single-stranded-DNA-specific exonuclease